MTRTDQDILFTALAFVAVLTNGQAIKPHEAPEKTRELARQINDFCALHVGSPTPDVLADEADAVIVDQLIERHVQELRANEATILPENRNTLIRLHDRLQIRNVRRINRVLYTELSDDKLADFVLSYLDEEIEAAEATA
ncbi:hypothetical protein NLM31_36845 [Bradyrhizobium sp. CCGUVB4N]|uniref:hypothetical protein n=1 Tax=Bradyrhizobium sp. CCGUVB4N TaxID=2949631 RepID=UPI0020B3A428|nr:hypothetical protein [Bradyrhizobium sp. CCGUVB4N]MCP3385971.1 hypothetical protein [Bradyrhizobium sp. CCGUVB4N]